MKRYRLYLLGITAFLMGGCLDENPHDQLPESKAYDNATNLYLNTVATLYNYIGGQADGEGLQGTIRGVYDLNTFTTDEAILPTRGGDWYDGGLWQSLYTHHWTESDEPFQNAWHYLYKVIVMCNRSLANIEAHRSLLTETTRLAYEAEARAIRAMYYYYLCDLFGRVPLVVSADVPLTEVQQSTRSEVFRFAFDELQAVAPLLPAERSNREGIYYGRITRPVAWFLLAKLALNAEVLADDNWTDMSRPSGSALMFNVAGTSLNAWQTCVAYCDSLTRFGYRLEPDYAANFAIHNEASTENIFTIPMDKMLYANQYCYLFRSRHYNHGGALGLGAENGSSATRSAMLIYGYGTAEADSRMTLNTYVDTVRVDGQVVRLDDGSPLVYMPLQVAPDLSGSAYEKTGGARMAKYEVDRTAYSDGKLQENDIVLFRYADVLLMKAEALMRQGLDGSAEYDAVRQRAGMPVRPLTEENLLAERLMELHWEGWRRQDMVRFGRFHLAYDLRSQLAGEESAYTTVFPIPGSALELNQKLSQNDGYLRR